MTKYLRRKITKFFVYALIVFGAYIIQTTPGLFDFFGIENQIEEEVSSNELELSFDFDYENLETWKFP